jgi:hypothetical protein
VASSVVTEYATSASGGTETEDVFCPANDVATGGGGYGSAGYIEQSEPTIDPTLTTALSASSATTSLKVTAILQAVTSGDTIQVVSGSNTQTFVASATASAGATTINVTSKVAGFAYPVGTDVNDQTSGLLQAAPLDTASGTAPGQSQGWQAEVSNFEGNQTVTAYVICSH